MRRYGLLITIALAAGIAVPLLLGGGELLPALLTLPAWTLPLTLGLVVVGWNCNAARVRLLSSSFGLQLSQWRALGTIMAVEFAFVATPAGGGGPVALVWLLQQRGARASDGAAVFAVDQIIDLLFFMTAIAAIALTFMVTPADSGVALHLTIMALLVALAIAALLGLLHHYRHWLLVGGKLLRPLRISGVRRRRIARAILRFRAAVQLMLKLPWHRLLLVYLLCAGHWLIRYTILFIILRAIDIDEIGWGFLFVTQMVAFTAGQFTFLPGGTGGVEITITAMLGPLLGAATLAAVMLVWRFATFHWYLIAGGTMFALLAGRPLWQQLRGR